VTSIFGQNVLKGPKNSGVSMIDVKNPFTQDKLRAYEKLGLTVDEKTGTLISFKTPEISKNMGLEDIEQRLTYISELAKYELEK